jgi:membrane protein YdbS with pleckstrin-like domain
MAMVPDEWPDRRPQAGPDRRPQAGPDRRPQAGPGRRPTGPEAPPERSVLVLHLHWKVLVRPVLLGVLVIAVAVAVTVVIPAGTKAGTERLVVLVVALVLLLIGVLRPVLRWKTTTYELTTGRLRVREGILTRRGRDIPLTRISDVSFTRGPLDRLVGAGRLVVESAGEHGQIVLSDIPQVERVQAILFELVEEERYGDGR